eukprot:1520604-Prymnesium_polylepis.1
MVPAGVSDSEVPELEQGEGKVAVSVDAAGGEEVPDVDPELDDDGTDGTPINYLETVKYLISAGAD